MCFLYIFDDLDLQFFVPFWKLYLNFLGICTDAPWMMWTSQGPFFKMSTKVVFWDFAFLYSIITVYVHFALNLRIWSFRVMYAMMLRVFRHVMFAQIFIMLRVWSFYILQPPYSMRNINKESDGHRINCYFIVLSCCKRVSVTDEWNNNKRVLSS